MVSSGIRNWVSTNPLVDIPDIARYQHDLIPIGTNNLLKPDSHALIVTHGLVGPLVHHSLHLEILQIKCRTNTEYSTMSCEV